MAVGRISGPLLKANLERNGIDLAVETDLLYIDVTNNRIGINKNSPGCDLDVNGTICSDRVQTDFLTVQNNYNLGNVNITTTVGDLELSGATGTDRTKVIGDLEVTGSIIGLNFNDAFTIVDDTSTATNVELGQTLHFQSNDDIDVVTSSDSAANQVTFSVTSTLDSVTGRGNVTTNDITVGSATASSLFTSLIDTTDSSAITVVPNATFNSDVTVENDINLTNNLEVNNIQQTSANEETLSTTSAQTITHFDGATFSSGKLIVQVRDNVTSEVQVCQISIIHDTVTASTTEYSNLFTGANPLASFTATIRGADVHLDAIGASANSTTYKVLKTLIRFL